MSDMCLIRVMRSSYQSDYYEDIVPSHLSENGVPCRDTSEHGKESGDGKNPSDDAHKRAMVLWCFPQKSIGIC